MQLFFAVTGSFPSFLYSQSPQLKEQEWEEEAIYYKNL